MRSRPSQGTHETRVIRSSHFTDRRTEAEESHPTRRGRVGMRVRGCQGQPLPAAPGRGRAHVQRSPSRQPGWRLRHPPAFHLLWVLKTYFGSGACGFNPDEQLSALPRPPLPSIVTCAHYPCAGNNRGLPGHLPRDPHLSTDDTRRKTHEACGARSDLRREASHSPLFAHTRAVPIQSHGGGGK